jgi:hypothetical protein
MEVVDHRVWDAPKKPKGFDCLWPAPIVCELVLAEQGGLHIWCVWIIHPGDFVSVSNVVKVPPDGVPSHFE